MSKNQQLAPSVHSSRRAFIWLIVAGVIAVLLSMQIYANIQEQMQLEQQVSVERQNYETVQLRKTELENQLAQLNDDQYVLKLARARGFFSRADEIIFNLPSDNSTLKGEQNLAENLNK